MSAKCIECGKTFNLLDETDANELRSGHDCETSPEAYTVYELPYYSQPCHVEEVVL
jgi:transposase-like protein